MITNKCGICSVESKELTRQPDGTYVCKGCYDEGFSLTNNGLFSIVEYYEAREFMDDYYDKQRQLIRLLFKKTLSDNPKLDINESIELTKDLIDKFVNIEAEYAISDYKMIRSELLKYPYKHIESVLKALKSSVIVEIWRDTETTVIPYEDQRTDMLGLYRYYNPSIPINI